MDMTIAYARFSLWIIALAVSLDNAHATNQHMVCKTVETVFTNEVVGPNFSRPKAVRGPAGSRGPSGVKGERGLPGSKGERGLPSTFNLTDIENMMEANAAATKELRDRIEILEKKVTELNSTSPSWNQSAAEEPEEIQCEDGIIYRKKCYFAFVHPRRDVPLTNAQNICERNHGKLADILDLEHQGLINNYLRPKRPSSQKYVAMWLGMLYQISTKKLQWSDGTIVDAPLHWFGNYPEYVSSYTNVGIVVYKVTTATLNGLFNDESAYSAHGALCEK